MAKTTEVAQTLAETEILRQLPVSAQATTSRVVVNNPLVRVVYFAFDAGELLTEHSSPRAVVVTMLAGSVRFTTAGIESRLLPGDLVYLAPGEKHSLVAEEPSHLSLVMIDTPA